MLVFLFALLLLTACSARHEGRAELRDRDRKVVGSARLTEVTEGVRVAVEVNGLPPGLHGIHIHDAGRCDPPEFTSAGNHFSPNARSHDHSHPAGHHEGDLPNLQVNAEGKGKIQATVDGVTLRGLGHHSLFKDGGTSIVVHDTADDLRLKPGGRRIACGVIDSK
jgi:superoxide dismutase, Cu-Zn family